MNSLLGMQATPEENLMLPAVPEVVLVVVRLQ